MKEKPKLELKKRTIARLNNQQMRYVLGGDGDEDPTRVNCGITDPTTNINEIVMKGIVSLLFCKK